MLALSFNKKILMGSLKICVLAVVISLFLTAVVEIFIIENLVTRNPSEFWLSLKSGLGISVVVSAIVSLPISYVVLSQREGFENLSKELASSSAKLAFLIKYDQLTSLLTRRAFFQEAESSLKQVHDKKQNGAFCFMDLDHFKKINDTFGHSTGDKVLRLFGKVVKECLQPGEIAGRLGGEEFGVFLPNCTAEQSYEKAQKIVDEFKHQARIVNGKAVGCTLSIGVATIYPSDDFDQLLNAADRLLYLAKEGGRDCVVRQTKRDSENRIAA